MKFAVGIISLVGSEGIDCYDSNNGGCSHFCHPGSNSCSCPPCWTLQADLVTCEPAVDKIFTTCGHNGLRVDVDECVYTSGADTVVIGFGDDPACHSTSSDGILTVSTSLDGCGVTHRTENDNIIFSNTLSIISRVNSAGLVLAADLDLGVECTFGTVVGNIGATSVISEASSLTGGTSGAGELQFVAEYFTSDQFDTVIEGSDTVTVGEQLYFGIRPTNEIAEVNFFVTSCTVSDENGNNFAILDNMCPNSMIVSETSNFVNFEKFTMTYTSFRFIDAEEDQSNMDIECTLNVCLTGECPDAPVC